MAHGGREVVHGWREVVHAEMDSVHRDVCIILFELEGLSYGWIDMIY